MPKNLRAAGLRLNAKGLKHNIGRRAPLIPEEFALNRPPDAIHRPPAQRLPAGIRNTQFRLPYLSNLKKMDPVFDDPYDVAAQTIGKTRRPGDPDIVLDPDGIYELDDLDGSDNLEEITRPGQEIFDSFEHFNETEQYKQLLETTGMTLNDIRALRTRTVYLNFVTNQLSQGKVLSTFMLRVAGNGKGMIGYGQGKRDTTEGQAASDRATFEAIKSLKPIHLYEGRTIYGNLEGKFKSTKVFLRPQAPGFGIRANFYVHEVCYCAGISDVAAKVIGSMNGMNVVKATIDALTGQKTPEKIAKQRGMHVVDVRQQYFNGR
jgi:small subunit ribosomal protein S5